METLLIAVTLLITTAQGILIINCHSVEAWVYLILFLLAEQVSEIALMEILSLSRTQLILG